MKFSFSILSLLFLWQSAFSQSDDFWSSKSTSASTKPAGAHKFFQSQIAGVYGMRPLESIDVGKPTDLNSQKTEFEKLIERGKRELGDMAKKELKNYVKQEVTNALKKEVGNQMAKELGNQAGAVVGGIMNAMQENAEKKRAEEAERQRLYELEQERKKRLTIKANLRQQFVTSLEDKKIPVVAPQNETYFFILNQTSDSTLTVSMFNVFAQGGQLPYKVEMMRAYQKEIPGNTRWLYGPYKSFKEAQETLNDIALTAFAAFYEITEDKYYVHGGDGGVQSVATDDGDFWGTGKKSEQKSTSSDDFWGTKKN